VRGRNGRSLEEYALRAEAEVRGNRVTLGDEAYPLMYGCAVTGRCATVPFVVAEHAPSINQIGLAPTLHWLQQLAICSAAVLSLLYPLLAFTSRPWYSRRKVNDHAHGRLADSR
jgi:hypothetical protein